MKKLSPVIVLIMALIFSACATLLNQPVRPNYKIVDHKGVLAGAKVPKLIKDALVQPADYLSGKYFPDSYVFVANQKGLNLDGLIMWSKNFEVQAEVAKRIQTSVDFAARNSVSGDKDTIQTTMDIVTEIVTEQNISGLQMQNDWWIKLKYEDDREEFQYVAIYTIKKSLLEKFMNDAINSAENQQQLSEENKSAIAKLQEELRNKDYGLKEAASDGKEKLSEAAFDSFVAESE